MAEKQSIQLSRKEQQGLIEIVSSGNRPAREIRRANILLKSAEGWRDIDIADAYHTSLDTVRRTRRRVRKTGALAALMDKPRSGAPSRLSLVEESRLVALACSQAPAGRCRWTIGLLAEQAIAQGLIPPVVKETVRQVLQKTRSSRGRWRVGVRPKLPRTFWPV